MWLEVIQIILIGVSGYFTAWSYVAVRRLSAHVDGSVWDQVEEPSPDLGLTPSK